MIRVLTLFAIVAAVADGQNRPVTLDTLSRTALARIDGSVELRGLAAAVTVTRDRWGVPHIAAQSTADLYFAQGFVMAQDRLWQMEMWRRGTEGRLAEVLGPSAISRDRQARLLKYRGPVHDAELKLYHPDARQIMSSYVEGVNAFIETASAAGALPVEFVLTGIRPEPWTIGPCYCVRTPSETRQPSCNLHGAWHNLVRPKRIAAGRRTRLRSSSCLRAWM